MACPPGDVAVTTRVWSPAGSRSITYQPSATPTCWLPVTQPSPVWVSAQDAHVVGETPNTWRITFYDPRTPAWFAITVDKRTTHTLDLRMTTTAHFMHEKYGPFDAAIDGAITEPSYRAGVLREHAIRAMQRLESENRLLRRDHLPQMIAESPRMKPIPNRPPDGSSSKMRWTRVIRPPGSRTGSSRVSPSKENSSRSACWRTRPWCRCRASGRASGPHTQTL